MSWPEHVLQEIQRIRDVGVLGTSGRLKALFEFLAARGIDEPSPKEAEIALEVFGKTAAAGGEDDAVVRVYMHRLRRKLEDHYLRAGADSPVRLDIPRGEYRLVVADASPAAAPPEAGAGEEGSGEAVEDGARSKRLLRAPSRRVLLAAAFMGGVAAANLALWLLRPAAAGPPSAWRAALGGRPLAVVVGDYYIFGEFEDRLFLKRLIRDFSINSREDLLRSTSGSDPSFDRFGDVGLAYLPTSAAPALAALAPILAGRSVEVFTASELSAETVKTHDVVYVGLISGLGSLKPAVFAASRFEVGESYDEIRDVQSGTSYTSEAFVGAPGDTVYRDFALLSTFASPSGGRVTVLAGVRDAGLAGLAEAFGAPGGAAELNALARRHPDFEALLEVRGSGGTSLETKVIASGPVDSAAAWSPERSRSVIFPSG